MKPKTNVLPIQRLLAAIVLAVLMTAGSGGRVLAADSNDNSSDQQTTPIAPTVAGADSETVGGGGQNIVRVINRDDNQLRVDGRIQLNHIEGANAAPVNQALAFGYCNGCQTFAVALQINLFSPSATNIHPQNYAYAINYKCSSCTTVADALQYNITVKDPSQVARDERDLIRSMSQELRRLRGEEDLTVAEVQSRIDGIIAEFNSLTADLHTQRSSESKPTSPGATNSAP